MDSSKSAVRQTLNQVKGFLAQESPPKLTEADTKANFIEPIIAALGWTGIGLVTREYYVKNSQEFIDYVMRGPSGLLLAIEAKALQADLTDKAAAQLIQYCSVEGIEWAALTNGRELQFFNTFLKPDLGAKRILSLDLLAFNSDEEFDALYQQVSQLSRENMTTPTGVRNWLNQRRMDATLRGILFNPSSPITKQLRKSLDQAEIKATPQDVVQWFRSHLGTPIAMLPPPTVRQLPTKKNQFGTMPARPLTDDSTETVADNESSEVSLGEMFWDEHQHLLPLFEAFRGGVESRLPSTKWRALKRYIAAEIDGTTYMAIKRRAGSLLIGFTLPILVEAPGLRDRAGEFNWSRISKVMNISQESQINGTLLSLVEQAAAHAKSAESGKKYFGVTLNDLLEAGLLQAGEPLLLRTSTKDLTTAAVAPNGDIIWQEKAYPTPSDRAFAALMGRQSLNGWTAWFVERPDGRKSLADLRSQLRMTDGNQAPDSAVHS